VMGVEPTEAQAPVAGALPADATREESPVVRVEPTEEQAPAGGAAADATRAEAPAVRIEPTEEQVPAGGAAEAPTQAQEPVAPVEAIEAAPSSLGTGPALARTLSSPRSGRRRWLFGAAAAAVVLLVGGVVIAKVLGGSSAPERLSARLGTAVRSIEAPRASAPGLMRAAATLLLEGRAEHHQVPPSQRVRTHLMLTVRGKDVAPAQRDPVHLSLVIDRSGSMRGERIQHAKAAARTAIERLSDGDMVSAVAFDTRTTTLIAPTVLEGDNRASLVDSIEKLALGGDTCISCGLDAAAQFLETSSDWVGRVLLLSDGDANHGVRDIPGFRRIGEQFQHRDASITSIGVGLTYNERILSALSRAANGRHYFIEDLDNLPAIFDQETRALGAVVASETEAYIELAHGVELVRVRGRTHRREGSKVVVSLGQLSREEVRTVLLEVVLDPRQPGRAPVCDARLRYRDRVSNEPAEVGGRLDLRVAAEAKLSERDPVVEVRIQRSHTSTALSRATQLFYQGQAKKALGLLDQQATNLERQRQRWKRRSVKPAPTLARDLADQSQVIDDNRREYEEALRNSSPAAAATQTPAARANRRGYQAADAYDL